MQLENLRTNERLSASAEKNKDLSAESQRVQLHNQLLMKCVGELTAITKRKEGTIEQLRRCIQNAEKVTDIPLPPTEQVLLPCTLFLISTGELLGALSLDSDCSNQSICCTSSISGSLHVAYDIRYLLLWSHCLCPAAVLICKLSTLKTPSCPGPSVCMSSCSIIRSHFGKPVQFLMFVFILEEPTHNAEGTKPFVS